MPIMIFLNYSISIMVDPVNMVDEVLSEEYIEWGLRRVCPNRAGVPSGMRVKHLKIWLATVQVEEKSGRSRWWIVEEIIQLVFVTG